MSREWYREAFGRLYAEVYAHRDESEARATVDLLLAATAVGAGAPILDAPCGAGRHAREFARRGYPVCGMDLSADLLSLAAARASSLVRLARGDLRNLPFASSSFGLVTNLFSSLGYFGEEHENRRQVSELARVCRPGGFVVVDFFNASHVARSLRPESERTTPGGLRVRETRRITGDPPRVEKRTEVRGAHDGDEVRMWTESVRLYEPAEVEQLVAASGLRTRHLFGDYDGSPHGPGSPRFILVGEKP